MTPRSSFTVLVVDDSEPLGSMLVQALELAGHRARWVGSAAAALAAADEEPPDVVLLDMNLGEVDGMDLARKLRVLLRTSGVRVIGLSGDPVPPGRRRALDAFLLKPVVLRDLVDALRD